MAAKYAERISWHMAFVRDVRFGVYKSISFELYRMQSPLPVIEEYHANTSSPNISILLPSFYFIVSSTTRMLPK